MQFFRGGFFNASHHCQKKTILGLPGGAAGGLGFTSKTEPNDHCIFFSRRCMLLIF